MDIKVDRITDMVLERLKKNNREKACETNEEKDTIHEENIVVKPRYKKGKKEMQADVRKFQLFFALFPFV